VTSTIVVTTAPTVFGTVTNTKVLIGSTGAAAPAAGVILIDGWNWNAMALGCGMFLAAGLVQLMLGVWF
jgi:hypothetical protein